MIQKTLFSGKIHRATITDANLHYEGSITIDQRLMQHAGMLAHEQVHVVNIQNGARFVTYVIPGTIDSGTICVNGAASRLVQKGDQVIIIAYATMPEHMAQGFTPRVVCVDQHNRIQQHMKREGYPDLNPEEQKAIEILAKSLYGSITAEADKTLSIYKQLDESLIHNK